MFAQGLKSAIHSIELFAFRPVVFPWLWKIYIHTGNNQFASLNSSRYKAQKHKQQTDSTRNKIEQARETKAKQNNSKAKQHKMPMYSKRMQWMWWSHCKCSGCKFSAVNLFRRSNPPVKCENKIAVSQRYEPCRTWCIRINHFTEYYIFSIEYSHLKGNASNGNNHLVYALIDLHHKHWNLSMFKDVRSWLNFAPSAHINKAVNENWN